MSEYDEYTHVLTSKDKPRIERRINALARQKCRYDLEKDRDRISSLKLEYLALCIDFFKVKGSGVSGPYDDTLLDILYEAWDRYDAEKGKIVHYIRNVYSKRVISAGNKEKRRWDKLAEYPNEEPDGDSFSRSEAKNLRLVAEASSQVALASENDFTKEAQRTSAAFLEVVSLVTGMLDHVEDGVYHTPTTKLYVRMCFTEALTRTVKREAAVDTAQMMYGKHEREAFRATELPFLDSFMVEICRTVRALWGSALREGCGEIFRTIGVDKVEVNEGWKLPNKVFLDYLSNEKGKDVSAGLISQQRAKFRKMFSPLVAKAAQQRADLDEG